MQQNHEPFDFGGALAQWARPAAVFADAEGYVRFWNVGAEQMFGHSAPEAIGQRVDLIVPPELREAHWSGFDRALASSGWRGSRDWASIPALHRNGDQMTLEVFLFPIERTEGLFAGVVALFRTPV